MKKTFVVIIGLIVIVLISFFILILNGERIVIASIKPTHHFDAKKMPPVPDYSNESNWAALPTKKDEADLVPTGAGIDGQKNAAVDLFYIHPTGYYRKENWNSPLDSELAAHENTQMMLAVQASVFNGCCRIYAPQYREATLYAFLDKGKDGTSALDAAYGDVLRAFDYYIKHYNHGRPFIIASHSQGSVHALRLIEERIDRAPLFSRFVAGYVIGMSIPAEKITRSFTRVRACSADQDTGCILTWNTLRQNATPRKIGVIWYRTGWETVGDKPILCINPLTWKTDEQDAPKELNEGAIFPKMDGILKLLVTGKATGRKIVSLPAPQPRTISARCVNGRLYVPVVDGIVDITGQGSYHVYDYHLFYINIRQNACKRIDAFLGLSSMPLR